jgi:hypothetical protein
MLSNIFVASTGATRGGIQEALSIPFQQTARFVRDHPYLVTDAHREAIHPVLNMYTLAARYVPTLSDPVKWAFWDGDASLLPAYFRAWFQMGLMRPMTYISATVANSHAYWAPVRLRPDNRHYVRGHHSTSVFYTWHRIPGEAFDFSDSHDQPMRDRAAYWFYRVSALPGLNFLFQLANYTWLLIALALALFQAKKRAAIVAFIPAALMLLTCIAGPVNGEVRYFLPIICAAPMLFMFTVKKVREDA